MFRYKTLNPDEVKRFETPYNENFTEVHLNDTTVNPSGDPLWKPVHCIMPARYRQYADRIRNFTVYEDDVWVITFLKSGTTWTQEMVWLIDHDLDYNTASAVNLVERSVYFELASFVTNFGLGDTISQVEQLPRPRHIKSHLPLALLPKQLWTVKPKIIYTARNPKDVTTSLMHHYKHLHGFKGSKQDFLDGILADKIIYCPLVKHATEFWAVSHRDNVLFLHFEDMKKDLAKVLLQVCQFFGKTFTSTQLSELEQHLSFDSMKANNSANNQTLVTQMEIATGVFNNFRLASFVTNVGLRDTISQVEQLPRPRHIKSHLPLALLPKQLWTVKPKIIYTARNPKDVTTSLMHHYKHLHGFNGSKQDFLDGILADKVIYCPLVKHATEFWAVSHRDNVLFLHYEDMKKDLAKVLLHVCQFFGKTFTSTQLSELEQHLSFDSMKANNSANNQTLVTQIEIATGVFNNFRFMRKGQVGGYKDELPTEFVSKLDEHIQDQLNGTGFEYRE